MENEINANKEVLRSLLDDLNVPALRKEPTHSNLLWLQRNLLINNGATPEAKRALELVRKILSS